MFTNEVLPCCLRKQNSQRYKHIRISEYLSCFTALRKRIQPDSLNLSFKIKDRERLHVDQLAKYKKDRIDSENAYTKVVVQHFPPLNTNEKA